MRPAAAIPGCTERPATAVVGSNQLTILSK